MTLLNRYILRSFFRVFFLALAAFVGIYLLLDFFDKIDDFIEHQARLPQYLLYFFTEIPLIVSQVTPLAILMAVFMTLGGFSRTNELTAMRSGGVSLWSITAPLLGVSLLAALTILAGNEFFIPLCAKKVNYVLETEVKGKPALESKRDRLWLREGNSILNIRLALPEQQTLRGVSIFQIDDDFRLQTRTDAAQATFDGKQWTLHNVVEFRFDPASTDLTGIEHLKQKKTALAKTPADFRGTEHSNDEMGYRELRNLARKLQAEGYDATRQRVDMQARLAMPFACVIMAFLGIPFALKKGRGTNLAVGVAFSVAIGITFHILQAMLLAFGYSSVIPPLVAGWSADLLFVLFGVWLLLSARE